MGRRLGPFTRHVFALFLIPARSATPPALLRHIGIRLVIGVAVRTVGLGRVPKPQLNRRDATLAVYPSSNCLQVIGSDACSVPAQMVDLQAIGDGAAVQFVTDSVGKAAVVPDADVAVAVLADVSIVPASVAADLAGRHEPLANAVRNETRVLGRTPALEACQMHRTHSPIRPRWPLTSAYFARHRYEATAGRSI